jgi:hypothetical protein
VLPDGVLFAFQYEVQTQVFCKDKLIGNTKKLKGTGVLQLPNGCVLQVLDKNGKVTKVKGQPQYTMVSAGNIELMPDGPLSAIQADMDTNTTKRVSTVNAFVEQRISSVINQVDGVDSKIIVQHSHVWGLTGVILMIVTSCFLMVILAYRCSNRARNKLRILKRNMADISQHVFSPEGDKPDQPEDVGSNPPSPRRKRDILRDQLRDQRHRAAAALHLTEKPPRLIKEPIYMSMNELYAAERRNMYVPELSAFRPLSSLRDVRREYPRLTPLMRREFDCGNDRELEEETEQVNEFCEVTSPRLTSKMNHQNDGSK